MAHGGKRVPARGFYLHRDMPRRTSTLNDERTPAALVFMSHDRIERTLAQDTDAYRVRRMLDARDLWTVVPDTAMHASTEYEREYFDDIARIISSKQSQRQYFGAILSRRWQIQRARGKRSQQMQRVMGND